MAHKSTERGALEQLEENGNMSELDTSDDEEENVPDRELDDSLERFDGDFDDLIETDDTTIVDIARPNDEFPITQEENIKWLQQPFQCPAVVLRDLETPGQVDVLRNPIDYFLQYFDEDFFGTVAFNTNLYAVQKGLTDFKPTNKQEIQTLIAIHLMMGCLQLPRVRMYWEEKSSVPIISNSMSRNRFLQLQNNLHIINNLDVPSNNVDKFIKVRPLYDQIKKKCNKLPKVRNVCVGEHIVSFKETLSVNQYMGSEASPWSVKMFVLASESGMIYDFILYQGSSTELDKNDLKIFGFKASVVLFLAQTLKEKSHFLYFDKFFSTYSLFERLYSLGIYAAGTVRPDRFGQPPLLSDKLLSKLGRGSTYEIRSNVENACTIGLVKWFDYKSITYGSNFITSGVVDNEQRFDKKLKKYVTVEIPEIVKLYNASIVGSQKSDQMISLYRTFIKSKKWTLRLIFHAFDLVANNAWLQYKKEAEELLIPKKNILNFLNFRLQLSEEMMNTTSQTPPKKNNNVDAQPNLPTVQCHQLHLPYNHCIFLKLMK